MSSVNPFEQAAIPSAIAILKALQEFKNDLGSDPLKLPLTAGPAFMKFTANVELLVPSLAAGEWEAVGSAFDTKVSGWISSLQAKINPPALATVTTSSNNAMSPAPVVPPPASAA